MFSSQYMSWGSGTGLIEQQFYEEEWIEKEFGVFLGGSPDAQRKGHSIFVLDFTLISPSGF